MRSCKEISRLTSDSLDSELPLMTRMGMRMHMWMCTHCARFLEQLQLLQKIFRRYEEQAVSDELAAEDGPHLGDEARQRMNRIIRQTLDGEDRA